MTNQYSLKKCILSLLLTFLLNNSLMAQYVPESISKVSAKKEKSLSKDSILTTIALGSQSPKSNWSEKGLDFEHRSFAPTASLISWIPIGSYVHFSVNALGKRDWDTKDQWAAKYSFQGHTYLGAQLKDISPGWNTIIRAGIYYENDPKGILAIERSDNFVPAFSLFYTYQREPDRVLHLDIHYLALQLQKDVPVQAKDDLKRPFPYGVGARMGEIITMNSYLGFFYALSVDYARHFAKNAPNPNKPNQEKYKFSNTVRAAGQVGLTF